MSKYMNNMDSSVSRAANYEHPGFADTILPRSRDSQGQETFLTPSADKQTRNYD